MWTIRTKDGQRTAEVDNIIASRMICELQGRWTQKNFVERGITMVYEFTDSGMFGNPAIQLWVSKGYYLMDDR